MVKQYKIYDLGYEYKKFVGSKLIAVVSNLTKEQLLSIYPQLKERIPFVLLSEKQWGQISSGISEFNKNEEKHRKRRERHGDLHGYRDGETEVFMKCVDGDTVLYQVIKNIEKEKLHKAFELLTKTQKKRIYLYFYNCYTYDEIAKKEKVDKMAVYRSIEAAIKN